MPYLSILTLFISFFLIVNPAYSQESNSAIEQLIEKAESGDSAAQAKLALKYHNGKDVEKDYDMAYHWFHEAAEQDSGLAKYGIATMFEYGTGRPASMEDAMYWYTEASRFNYVMAHRRLGQIYGKGITIGGERVEPDLKKSFRFFRKGAKQLDRTSQYYLGLIHLRGLGTPAQTDVAIKYFEDACEHEIKRACEALDKLAS